MVFFFFQFDDYVSNAAASCEWGDSVEPGIEITKLEREQQLVK